jgi:hypothetical protein
VSPSTTGAGSVMFTANTIPLGSSRHGLQPQVDLHQSAA